MAEAETAANAGDVSGTVVVVVVVVFVTAADFAVDGNEIASKASKTHEPAQRSVIRARYRAR